MIDLAAEFDTAMSMTRSRDWCRRDSIPDETRLAHPGPVTVACIEISDKLFEFGGTTAALVHPVWSDSPLSDPIDLIAYHPAKPDSWWLRTGVATALGSDCIDTAIIFEVPLLMFRTPFSWLQNQGAGVCVLDWQAMRLDITEVAMATAIIPEDVDHGDEIERHLIPPRPDLNILIWSAAE